MLAAPQAALPPQQGPTEKRLLEQDAKIANMQASLEQLTQSQKHHAKHVESQFKQAAQREQDNMNKMDSALKQIEKSVDKAMTKSFNQYQASMDEKFQEIKHLFMSNKRTAPPDEEDTEDWLTSRNACNSSFFSRHKSNARNTKSRQGTHRKTGYHGVLVLWDFAMTV